MQVEIIEAFITAALEVLEQEVGEPASAGPVKMLSSAQTSEEVCVMIGVAGALRGMALLGMSVETARSLVERMLGEPCLEFDDMAQSGIAEMANVITGVAGQRLESLGYPLTISPPALIVGGPGIVISTVNIRRFVVPLHTAAGNIVIHAALEKSLSADGPAHLRHAPAHAHA